MLEKLNSNIMMKKVLKHAFEYLYGLCEKYGIDVDMVIYTHDTKNVPDVVFDDDDYTIMCVCHVPSGDNNIIEIIKSTIYMHKMQLMKMIIDYGLDIDRINSAMEYYIKHEFGHVIDVQSHIGSTPDEWNARISPYPNPMKKLRKNASFENILKWSLEYDRLPSEKIANEYVGLIEQDTINYLRDLYGIK